MIPRLVGAAVCAPNTWTFNGVSGIHAMAALSSSITARRATRFIWWSADDEGRTDAGGHDAPYARASPHQRRSRPGQGWVSLLDPPAARHAAPGSECAPGRAAR